MCHLFFNITGIALFYPIPFMRWPISAAKALGRTVEKYRYKNKMFKMVMNINSQAQTNFRWFAFLYLIVVFFLLPGYVVGLSFIDQENYIGVYVGFFPLVLLFLIIIVINVVQKKRPKYLPKFLKNWHFLPYWMRSFEPLDRFNSF